MREKTIQVISSDTKRNESNNSGAAQDNSTRSDETASQLAHDFFYSRPGNASSRAEFYWKGRSRRFILHLSHRLDGGNTENEKAPKLQTHLKI